MRKIFKSFSNFFNYIDEHLDYIVLRNEEEIGKDYNYNINGDIDILVSDYKKFIEITDAISTSKLKHRVQCIVKIGDKNVVFDVRSIGDNYYPQKWAKEMLTTKQKYVTFENIIFFIPNKENYYNSLIYHVFVHKLKIKEEYYKKLKELKENNFFNREVIKEDLIKFMIEKNYKVVEPNDLDVIYNSKEFNKKKSLRRFFHMVKLSLSYRIKKVLKIVGGGS